MRKTQGLIISVFSVAICFALFQNCSEGFQGFNSTELSSAGGPAGGNDGPVIAPLQVSVLDSEVLQGDSARVRIQLNRAHTEALMFEATTRAGTALEGTDYSLVRATVTIAAGQTAAEVRIPTRVAPTSPATRAFSLEIADNPAVQSTKKAATTTIRNKVTSYKAKAYFNGPLACVLTMDDQVNCWGATTAQGVKQAIQAAYLNGVKALDSLYNVACAITAQDTVQCWGTNSYGELGNGQTTAQTRFSAVPVNVLGVTDAKLITTGAYHACALKGAREIWCWGLMGTAGPNPALITTAPADVTRLISGEQHSCFLMVDNKVRCIGLNSARYNTEMASGLAAEGVKDIAAGRDVQCWTSMAGDVECILLANSVLPFARSGERILHPTLKNVKNLAVTENALCGTDANNALICQNSLAGPAQTIAGLTNAKKIVQNMNGPQAPSPCILDMNDEIKCGGADAVTRLPTFLQP